MTDPTTAEQEAWRLTQRIEEIARDSDADESYGAAYGRAVRHAVAEFVPALRKRLVAEFAAPGEQATAVGMEPTISTQHPFSESIGDAVIDGTCYEAAWVRTDRDDCDVLLMVDQDAIPGRSRHALLRMSDEEAEALGMALLAAARTHNREKAEKP